MSRCVQGTLVGERILHLHIVETFENSFPQHFRAF